MYRPIVNAVSASSTPLAPSSKPRLQAQLYSGLQLSSTLGNKPRVSAGAILLANNYIRHADAHNNLADKQVAREKAAASAKATELARRAANPQLAAPKDCPPSTSASSCQPHAWQRPPRDPQAPHPAYYLMHSASCPDQPKPQQHLRSLQASHPCPPQQHHSTKSSCQTQAPLTKQPAGGSAQSHPAASCDTKATRLAPVRAPQNTQRQPLHEAKPTSASCSQPLKQHSLSSSEAHAQQQQQPMSLVDRVAAKFAAYVPPSSQRCAAVTPTPSLGDKLAARFAAFLAKPARQAQVVAAA